MNMYNHSDHMTHFPLVNVPILLAHLLHMYNIHYMTHFPLTALCDGVDALLVSTVTLSINVVSNKRVSPCEVGGGGGGGREEGK